MTEVNVTKEESSTASQKRRKRYIYLLIFAFGQLAFFLLDDSSYWMIFNLNPYGEWVVDNIALPQWVQLYENPAFNFITVIWAIVLIIAGVISIFCNLWSKKEKNLN